MKTVVEELQNWKKKVLIEEDAATIKTEIDLKIKEYAKQVKLPGFRPGKVPVSIVKKRYGASIESEVLDATVNNCYRKALKDNNIEPIHQYPVDGDKLSYDKDNGLKFEVLVEVEPSIDVSDYKGHGISPKRVQVTKKKVAEEIDKLREQYAEYVEVDRAAVKGDWAVVDYEAVDQDDFDPKLDYRLKISEQPNGKMDAFIESVIGKKKDDKYELDYKFPDEASVANLSGKEVKFLITIKKIEEAKLPEIDEEFLKNIQFETKEDWEASIKESISENEKQQARTEAFNKIIEFIIEKNSFEIPESMVENYISNKMKELKIDSDSIGDSVKDNFREEAVKEVKKYLILDAVAKKEGIKATSKDVDKKIEEIAAMYGLDVAEMKDGMRKRGEVLRLREDLKIEKTIDFLIKNAKGEE